MVPSTTKYRSEAVLYSKQTAVYPLSPHIKAIAKIFYQLSDKATKMLQIINSEKNNQQAGAEMCQAQTSLSYMVVSLPLQTLPTMIHNAYEVSCLSEINFPGGGGWLDQLGIEPLELGFG